MRKHFAYIKDGDGHENYEEGEVSIRNKEFPTLEKNKEGVINLRNLENNETWEITAVGLGYHDFDDRQDYEDNVGDVIAEKLDEAGIEHSIGEDE